jgi:DNA-binding HxlR family transcriptional regulator
VVAFVAIMRSHPGAEPSEPVCPVLATARIVSGKWTLLVLRDLADGPRRFSELERSLAGISPRTLSQRLRSLEEEGIIERRQYAEVPPRVDYRLTPKGADLVPIVDAMRHYGARWLGRDEDGCDEAAAGRRLEALAS